MTYPCEKEGDAGSASCSRNDFPTPTGKARFVPAKIIPGAEPPDADYPFVLITGRQLEHWHTGSMTRRTEVLDEIEPIPVASLQSGGHGAAESVSRRHDHGRVAPRTASRWRRARTPARRAARCSFRSATTRPPRIC